MMSDTGLSTDALKLPTPLKGGWQGAKGVMCHGRNVLLHDIPR